MGDIRQRGAHILVGTPGRVKDLMKRMQDLVYKELEVFVLDEADRSFFYFFAFLGIF